MHTCAYTHAHHLLNFVDIDKFDGVLQVLREPKNALGKQYQKLFSMNNVSILLSQHSHLEVQQLLNLDQCCQQVKLHFTENALRLIAKKAMAKNTGARGLRGILESILMESMYEVC